MFSPTRFAAFCFLDGFVHYVNQIIVFAAIIDVASFHAERESTDQHSFDQSVRIEFEQITVFKCSRLGFVRITDNIFRLRRISRNKTPFHSRRKTRTAATAKCRRFDFVNDLVRRTYSSPFSTIYIRRVPDTHSAYASLSHEFASAVMVRILLL